jgi:DNA-binding transcriptional regulator YiaG
MMRISGGGNAMAKSKAVERKSKEGDNKRTTKSPSEHSSQVDKLSPAGAKIVSAFHEAIEAMRKGGPAENPIDVRTYKADFTCRPYGPKDVHRVRGLLGMSQVFFARFLGVDPNTVRSWEQGSRPPSPIARRFMGEIEEDPEYWRRLIAQRLVRVLPPE